MDPATLSANDVRALTSPVEFPRASRAGSLGPPLGNSQLPTDIYDSVMDRFVVEGAESNLEHSIKVQTAFASVLQAGSSVAATGSTNTSTSATEQPSSSNASINPGLEDLLSRLPDSAREEIKKFLNGSIEADFFSPEKTANRIVDFALGGFAHFEGGAAQQENSVESRQRFADFIRPAIDRGFELAREFLGPLDEEVEATVTDTRGRIDERFDEFVGREAVDETA